MEACLRDFGAKNKKLEKNNFNVRKNYGLKSIIYDYNTLFLFIIINFNTQIKKD